jgi:membrane protein DedA with SNARE-associated domain
MKFLKKIKDAYTRVADFLNKAGALAVGLIVFFVGIVLVANYDCGVNVSETEKTVGVILIAVFVFQYCLSLAHTKWKLRKKK